MLYKTIHTSKTSQVIVKGVSWKETHAVMSHAIGYLLYKKADLALIDLSSVTPDLVRAVRLC